MNKLLPNELLNEIVLFIPLKALRNGNHLGISANFMHLFAFIRYELLIVRSRFTKFLTTLFYLNNQFRFCKNLTDFYC